MLDLRVPSGIFFVMTGLILVLVGLFSPSTRAALTAVNVNLYSGAAMLVFGGIMLFLARTVPQKSA